MAATYPDRIQQAHYDTFIAELTALTRRYGVALRSIGGVYLADQPGEFADVSYRADSSSGDLDWYFPGEE